MAAILNQKHFRFCKLVEDFRTMHSPDDQSLARLESELNDIFAAYQHSIEDIKKIITEYNIKQRAIHQRMKLLSRDEKKNNQGYNSKMVTIY